MYNFDIDIEGQRFNQLSSRDSNTFYGVFRALANYNQQRFNLIVFNPSLSEIELNKDTRKGQLFFITYRSPPCVDFVSSFPVKENIDPRYPTLIGEFRVVTKD